MSELVPIYSQEPDKLAKLHDRLDATFGEVLAGAGPDDMEFSADCKDWSIVLRTWPDHQLDTASMTRCGTETYDFKWMGMKDWVAVDPRTRFADAHFYNLVHLATMSGLSWTARPTAEQTAAAQV